MAKRTVDELDGKRKREEAREARDEARRELDATMARFATLELACSEPGSAPAALLDRRLRAAALESARRGLGVACGRDDTAPGTCPDCGGRTRLSRREKAAVETVVGAVRVEMARRACRECGRSSRPRERLLDIRGSMTLATRRLASVAGSEACCERADELVRELAGLNLGAKRIERTTRAVGADLEARRKAALEPAAAGSPAPALPERKSLKEGQTLCCALDGTGVPARPSETVGRAGKNGERAATREAKVGALWVSERDGGGRPRTVPGSVVLFAAVESAAETPGGESEFERRLLRELAAAGHAPEDVGSRSATAPAGCGGCSTTGSRSPSASWTTTTRRSTCGPRRAPATAPATWPRRGRGSCASGSRPTSPSAATGCATTTVSAAGCPSAPGGSRRPARPSSAGE